MKAENIKSAIKMDVTMNELTKEIVLHYLGFENITNNLYKHKTEHGMFIFNDKDEIVSVLIRFGEGMKAAEVRGVLGIGK